jgi:hypothetical protein
MSRLLTFIFGMLRESLNYFMDSKIQEQLNEQEVKINEIYGSVKKIERYMQITFWVTVVVVVLPMIIFIFAIPSIVKTLTASMSGLDGLI